ncbi:PREDICTED: uncharacterized protein LOC109583185 [Amphimedon queenslandica]|uniref:Secreted protein n=1 Tax=Amphimedon queenslandica TaxID=400682 RepID=A0A1X7UJ10_AMPQE|nr:PREDICTED: uncharacterized protein LOC109583185 [Amphimedon queenslandica]|eukprot:XP_019853980.1 PREDICTED: uncharacterized protein LOC109583185 [Amphimedon queenslandica]
MQKIVIILLAGAIVSCYAAIDETQCYETPKGTLYRLYRNCRKASESRLTKCTNVFDRYCSNVQYAFVGKLSTSTTGVMREIKEDTNEVSFSCIKATSKVEVEMSSLHSEVRGCDDLEKLQSGDCLLAIHRYCQNMNGRSSSGFAYSDSATHAKIACFDAVKQKRVAVNSLVLHNSKCDDPSKSASSDCFNAACKWCEAKGHDGGMTQGSEDNEIIVSCYDDYFHTTATIKNRVASTSDYYYRQYLAAKKKWEQAKQEEEPQEWNDPMNNSDEFQFTDHAFEE